MCVYWMKWYEKVVCFPDEILFTKLHKSCLAVGKDTLELFVQLETC